MKLEAEQFEKLLTALLRRLVSEFIAHPADLDIKLQRFENIISVAWRGNRADTSRMIGTDGATYRALQSYVRLVGEQHGYEVELERVGEPTRGVPERYAPFKANPDWRKAELLELFADAARAGSRRGLVEIESGDVGEERTGIMAKLSKAETLRTETQLRELLKVIFKVIGNANGRVLLVEVKRVLDPEPEQPDSARGRFARAQT